MGRRYLTTDEVLSNLKVGKKIDCFLGGIKSNNIDAIRWLSISFKENEYNAEVWESLDQGNQDYLDLYTFEGANGEYDIPVEKIKNRSFESLMTELILKFGDINEKLCNSGMIEEEYSDYIKNGRKCT